MKTQLLIFLVAISLFPGQLFAQLQNNYFHIEPLPFNEDMTSSIELSNGNIIAVYHTIKVSPPILLDTPNLVVIDNAGTIIQTQQFNDEFDNIRIYFLEKIDENEFFAIGYGGKHSTSGYALDTAHICYFRFNNNLELLSRKTYYFTNNFFSIGAINLMKKNDGNYLLLTDLRSPPFVLKIYEITKLGDSIGIYEVEKPMPINNTCFAITQKHDGTGYYMLDYGSWQLPGEEFDTYYSIVHLNNEFESTGHDSLPGQCAWAGKIQRFSDNKYLVSGESEYIWLAGNPPSYLVGTQEFLIETLDTSLRAINQSVPMQILPKTIIDTAMMPASFKAFDFIDTNYIYASYGYFPYSMTNESTPFYVVKYDKNLNIIWHYTISAEGYLMPQNVMATQDGGVFVSGFRSMTTYWTEADYFYLRTDSTGLILGSSIPGLQMHSATAYPNPGSDKLTLLTGPQIEGALLQIYDMNGRQIFKDKLKNQTTEINTNNWKSGSYPWRIIHNGKVVDEGVWVKQ